VDAFAQLALMAKAKKVFESPETFLSFPALSPLSYTPDELRFGTSGEMTPADLAEASEFARTANQIPRSVIAPIDEGEYLWDVYSEVLETARVASNVMSSAERAIYESALNVLYTTGEGGLRTDSDRMRAYKQHRDAVIEAQEEFKNQQLTAEASTDQAVLDQWRTVDEPRLRLAIQERENAWSIEGFKAEIEAAQQIELAQAAGAASSVWSEWRGSFNDDLDLATDTNQIRFALTGYSPYDIFDADNWPRFTISAEEMTKLAEEAPPELREIFAAGSTATEIESVSFEYRSVAVTRPWFRSALFKARFWRLPDGTESLSEGTDPPAGRCPAYVSALVFARNVVVKYKEAAGGATAGAGAATKFLRLDAAMLSPHLTHMLRATPGRVEPARVRVRDHRTAATELRTIDGGRAALKLRSMAFTGTRATLPSAAITRSLAAERIPIGGLRLRGMVARPMIDRGIVATTILTAPPIEPAPPPPEPAPPTREGEVIVLAYICKRVPRSPDPDPGLPWG
jgi:hypothetical protein